MKILKICFISCPLPSSSLVKYLLENIINKRIALQKMYDKERKKTFSNALWSSYYNLKAGIP